MVLVVSGTNYVEKALKYWGSRGFRVLDVYTRIFPDGEHYIRIKTPEILKGEKVVIINSMYPRQNDSFLETLMLIDATVRAEAEDIVLVLTYMAYARQDKVFLQGEPVTAEIMLKTINSLGIDKLAVVDIHNPKSLGVFKGTTINVLAHDLLVERILSETDEPILLAPDKGALHRVAYAAQKTGLQYDYLVKTRDRFTGEIFVKPKELNVEDRDVIVIDDIISTGGTIAKAAKILKKQGARRVFVAATHGLLAGDAVEKIKAANVEKIVLGDTLGVTHSDPLIEYVDIADKIIYELRTRKLI